MIRISSKFGRISWRRKPKLKITEDTEQIPTDYGNDPWVSPWGEINILKWFCDEQNRWYKNSRYDYCVTEVTVLLKLYKISIEIDPWVGAPTRVA